MKKLIQNVKPVVLTFPQACTSITTDYVSLADFNGCTILILVDNTSGTDTGAVALLQSTTNSGGSAKAIPFTEMWANLDTETLDALTETAVTSNTFNASGVTKSALYVIEVNADMLDVDNGFKFVNLTIATVTNGVVAVVALMHSPRHIDSVTTQSVLS